MCEAAETVEQSWIGVDSRGSTTRNMAKFLVNSIESLAHGVEGLSDQRLRRLQRPGKCCLTGLGQFANQFAFKHPGRPVQGVCDALGLDDQ